MAELVHAQFEEFQSLHRLKRAVLYPGYRVVGQDRLFDVSMIQSIWGYGLRLLLHSRTWELGRPVRQTITSARFGYRFLDRRLFHSIAESDFSGGNPENRASSGATLMQRKLAIGRVLGHVIREGAWRRPRVGVALSVRTVTPGPFSETNRTGVQIYYTVFCLTGTVDKYKIAHRTLNHVTSSILKRGTRLWKLPEKLRFTDKVFSSWARSLFPETKEGKGHGSPRLIPAYAFEQHTKTRHWLLDELTKFRKFHKKRIREIIRLLRAIQPELEYPECLLLAYNIISYFCNLFRGSGIRDDSSFLHHCIKVPSNESFPKYRIDFDHALKLKITTCRNHNFDESSKLSNDSAQFPRPAFSTSFSEVRDANCLETKPLDAGYPGASFVTFSKIPSSSWEKYRGGSDERWVLWLFENFPKHCFAEFSEGEELAKHDNFHSPYDFPRKGSDAPGQNHVHPTACVQTKTGYPEQLRSIIPIESLLRSKQIHGINETAFFEASQECRVSEQKRYMLKPLINRLQDTQYMYFADIRKIVFFGTSFNIYSIFKTQEANHQTSTNIRLRVSSSIPSPFRQAKLSESSRNWSVAIHLQHSHDVDPGDSIGRAMRQSSKTFHGPDHKHRKIRDAFRPLEGKGHSESQGIKELTPTRQHITIAASNSHLSGPEWVLKLVNNVQLILNSDNVSLERIRELSNRQSPVIPKLLGRFDLELLRSLVMFNTVPGSRWDEKGWHTNEFPQRLVPWTSGTIPACSLCFVAEKKKEEGEEEEEEEEEEEKGDYTDAQELLLNSMKLVDTAGGWNFRANVHRLLMHKEARGWIESGKTKGRPRRPDRGGEALILEKVYLLVRNTANENHERAFCEQRESAVYSLERLAAQLKRRRGNATVYAIPEIPQIQSYYPLCFPSFLYHNDCIIVRFAKSQKFKSLETPIPFYIHNISDKNCRLIVSTVLIAPVLTLLANSHRIREMSNKNCETICKMSNYNKNYKLTVLTALIVSDLRRRTTDPRSCCGKSSSSHESRSPCQIAISGHSLSIIRREQQSFDQILLQIHSLKVPEYSITARRMRSLQFQSSPSVPNNASNVCPKNKRLDWPAEDGTLIFPKPSTNSCRTKRRIIYGTWARRRPNGQRLFAVHNQIVVHLRLPSKRKLIAAGSITQNRRLEFSSPPDCFPLRISLFCKESKVESISTNYGNIMENENGAAVSLFLTSLWDNGFAGGGGRGGEMAEARRVVVIPSSMEGRPKWRTDCSLDNGRPSSLAWSGLKGPITTKTYNINLNKIKFCTLLMGIEGTVKYLRTLDAVGKQEERGKAIAFRLGVTA
ncbi:hypothetical protein WN51_11843 [Melipona quadrifasciata]|uniref:Uncharacterized protein n=1 Tax=Melipona quadrifasciata TaxID=166423 RepID=A0A0M9A2X4_9HYME|nr:hypothetical protein WN51_11843 [Melipona quadrifasciata]